MTKSHVSLVQHQCPVCGVSHDTGEVLLHKRMSPVLDNKTLTGVSFCPEHDKLRDAGYIALVEIDADGKHTGRLLHIRASVWPDIFNVPVPSQGLARIAPETLDLIMSIPGAERADASAPKH